ncbi:MFS transporter [Spirillospora sp. NBC_00431]
MTRGSRRAASALGSGTVLTVVLAGVLITGLDATIVVLALPEMAEDLNAPLNSVIWVVIAYLLVATLLTTQAGRLGDMFGRIRVYQIGFVIFTVASLLCVLSWNSFTITGSRALQAVGAAFITANSGAILSDVFPPEKRGKAFGYVGVCWSSGAVSGILAGGLLVGYASWHWIFLINIPIGGAVLLLARRLPRLPQDGRKHDLDPAGMVTLGLGLLGVLWAVTRLVTHPLGPQIIGVGAAGIVCLVLFVWVERRAKEPMLRPSLFRLPMMPGSLLTAMLQGVANYAVLWLALMYLQGPKGLSPLHASLLLLPGYLIAGVLSPTTGRITDRFGPVLPACAGLAVELVALFMYTQISLTSPLWHVVVANVVNGIGLGLFVPANNAAVMKAAPPGLYGVSAGMLRTFASIGWVFSFPVAILCASQAIDRDVAVRVFVGVGELRGEAAADFMTGFNSAFLLLLTIMAVALAVSALRAVNLTRRSAASPRENRHTASRSLEASSRQSTPGSS